MKFVKETRSLVLALIFISFGGWLLHLRLHPIPIGPNTQADPTNWIPFFFGIVSILASPILLSFRRTVLVGYLINGMSVIAGMILMLSDSLSELPSHLTAAGLVLKTAFPVSMLLFGKLFIGHQIFLHHHPHGMGRMFTVGWWIRHFIYLTSVFTIGHLIWR